jgi:hypothetical protein
MSSDALNWVIEYLENDETIIVPIKKMWNEWHASRGEPSLEVFTSIILADDRVQQMGGVDHAEGFEDGSPEELEEYIRDMEANGYFSGPRVKLKSREITIEHIAKMIKMHNDRMEAALQGARESLPEDIDEHDEGKLIEALVLAQKLRKQLRKLGLEPPEEDPK